MLLFQQLYKPRKKRKNETKRRKMKKTEKSLWIWISQEAGYYYLDI